MLVNINQTIAAAFIVTGVLIASVSPALALPPLPSSFWGTVKLSGNNLPQGAGISAWIDGVQYATATSSLYGGDTVYKLDVPGDDPGSVLIEGGVSGDTVVFKINGRPAQETGIWQSGVNLELDLTVTMIPVDWFPILLFGNLDE